MPNCEKLVITTNEEITIIPVRLLCCQIHPSLLQVHPCLIPGILCRSYGCIEDPKPLGAVGMVSDCPRRGFDQPMTGSKNLMRRSLLPLQSSTTVQDHRSAFPACGSSRSHGVVSLGKQNYLYPAKASLPVCLVVSVLRCTS